MNVTTKSFSISTQGHTDIIDITNQVSKTLKESGMSEGNALVFVPGATAGVTTIEYEPGLLSDYPDFFEKIIPSGANYKHNDTWHDGNGHSHVRASLQGASFQVPFASGKLLLGTWQQIILVDFDNRPRNRKVIVQLMGK
ncbi:MAG: secondary thiamine-phosphate synthase enzyme YjbQ [Melioribacteraceae bacterium]|nr:secondary thiamine-phosphate synthase enzyme YjbQ [Melioribacteraceae bacterium]